MPPFSRLATTSYHANLWSVPLSTERPSNLKEAIDWILRVTGKDGQGGDSNSAISKLSDAVKGLLKEVKGSTTGLNQDIDKVTQALNTDSGIGLIGKLADGLQQFIGYQSGVSNTKGLITGAGIAPSNIATHRLCDAAIAFTIAVLEGLSKDRSIKDNTGNKQKVNSFISQLSECYGKGPKGLKEIDRGVDKLEQVKGTGGNKSAFDSIISKVKEGFKSQLKEANEQGHDIDQKVGTYLSAVFQAVSGSANVTSQLNTLVSQATPVYDAAMLNSQIGGVKNALTPPGSQGFAKNVLDAGKKAFMAVLQKRNYVLANYEEASQIKWNSETEKVQTCAKIFLSCIPLMTSGLSYLYWECKNGWKAMQFSSGALRGYMMYMGYHSSYLGSSTGGNVIGRIESTFQDSNGAAVEANSTYLKFYNALRTQVNDKLRSTSDDIKNYPIAALDFAAQNYFTLKQSNSYGQSTGSPKSIREMLYFLAALPFSPVYEQFDKYITSYFQTLLNNTSGCILQRAHIPPGDTLSAADLKGYLTLVSHIAPRILGLIQGPGYKRGNSDEPWLFELYSNSIFQFKYSSGAAIFSAISNYSYALQFQLHFLFFMCSNDGNKCGWQECLYGRSLNADTSEVTSYICASLKCSEPVVSCDHNNTSCTHNKYDQNEGCGKGSPPSSLQAFMTDDLKGFRLHDSEHSSHMSQHLPGSMCHVPMGFKSADLRKNPAAGGNIYSALSAFCGSPFSPLRQLGEKLGCLTKRTPRLIGDIFGFTWHLKGQLAKTLGSFNGANWFGELKDKLPFSYELKNDSGQKLNKFLIDDLESGFQELLDEFKNIDCTKTGCRAKSGVTHACTSHAPGTHGTDTNTCTCESVVHCGGVLPLLYANGFSFASAYTLSGGSSGNDQTKRSCANFHTALSNVLTPNAPLAKLLDTIDEFLYLFRFYFFYNQSAFWTIYLTLIVYTFFFLLDTLRPRSHLHFPSSNIIAPISLLGTGKAPALRQFTKLTYFMP
ncbi:uncharacterized protein BcabD6B2_05520 [Babesia caballi]|uniref:Variant erythrocyte surface antigen-1, beta subunit n=1 Tax=Babesia caballi TaxID=5871 RepID=A0AAV4LLV5_BABCB|nr:hypothetical protein, conserved [Babesia caballi]